MIRKQRDGTLRIREGATAGNRGVPGFLEYREVAARGTPASPSDPSPLTPHMHFEASTTPLTPHSILALIAN
ncbi:unnamed protein product [Pieris brassicae]|uniref:Uncharacterized protein n=1 Tax=Pieris brassicae TaxID=7116 RepID=A0A9P0XC67_PIEBR|nr:unnamed protein product [Pieris brassicae]